MAAGVGAPDVLIAYPLVGPNCARLARLAATFPETRFSVLADHPKGVGSLSRVLSAEGQSVDVLLDVDVGMHRTGIAPGPEAVALYEQIHRSPGLRVGGLRSTTATTTRKTWRSARRPCERCWNRCSCSESTGGEGPAGAANRRRGHADFPGVGEAELPGLECSPGTCVLHDDGYGSRYPDMTGFTPAALLADARHQPAVADAGDVRPRLQGRCQRPAGRQALRAARRAGLPGGLAERGAPRHRDAARGPLPAGRRGAGDSDAHLSDLRAAQAGVCRRERERDGDVGNRGAGSCD